MNKTAIFVSIIAISSVANATTFVKTGKIDEISIMSSANASFEDVVTIVNYSSAGSCNVSSDGLVVIRRIKGTEGFNFDQLG